MLFFRSRRKSEDKRKSSQSAAVEGLENRRLLSASIIQSEMEHPADAGHAHIFYNHVTGTVVSTDTAANTITISSGGQGTTTQTTYNVDASTSITAGAKTVTLGDLVAGVKVVIRASSTDPSTALSIKAVARRVSGQVTAVDATAGTITLTPHGGSATTYTIPSSATVSVNHATSTLADVTVGANAQILFSPLSGTTITSVSAHTKTHTSPATNNNSNSSSGSDSSGNSGSSDDSNGSTSGSNNSPGTNNGGGGLGGWIGQNPLAFGTLVSVDTTANTITLSNTWDSSASNNQTTYTLASGATVTADGATSTLAALATGDQISLTLNTATPAEATAVMAFGKQVVGSVIAVDTTADTITLTPPGASTSSTVTIPSGAAITVNGATGTLSGITTGSFVDIQYSALDNTQVTSVNDFALPIGIGGNGAMGDQQQVAFGTLVSVDTTANTITLSSPWNSSGPTSQTTYTVGSSATITADGKTTALGSLAVGDQIFLTLSGGTTTTVTAVNASGKDLNGKVTAVDTTADTITLSPSDGSASTTVTIPAAATITVDGASGTLSGITTGSFVNIQYSATDNTQIVSVDDFTQPPNFGGPGKQLPQIAVGTLVSVDTTAGTITVSNAFNFSGTATQTTYTLGSGATITADGKTATLGALATGDWIELTLSSSSSTTATAVNAMGKSLDGKVTAVDTTADTITLTLTPDDGSASTTVTIPTAATITVNGSAGALTGITTGSQVHIQYSALDDTQIISVDAFTAPTGSGGGFFGGFGGGGVSGGNGGLGFTGGGSTSGYFNSAAGATLGSLDGGLKV